MNLQLVREEIESLHEFFCHWFGGSRPKSTFETEFLRRFSEDLIFIPPAGKYFGLGELCELVKAGYGSNPDFRIQIRNVRISHQFGDYVVATYEEWQRNALKSNPPNNGRIATVIFHVESSLTWLHLHETWLPEEVIEADRFQF